MIQPSAGMSSVANSKQAPHYKPLKRQNSRQRFVNSPAVAEERNDVCRVIRNRKKQRYKIDTVRSAGMSSALNIEADFTLKPTNRKYRKCCVPSTNAAGETWDGVVR